MQFRGIVSGKAEKLRESGGAHLLQDDGIVNGEVVTARISMEDYSLHGLRAGGATAAAAAGIPDRVFKHHGRWKSDNAKDGYVEDSLEKHLSVSQSLGL